MIKDSQYQLPEASSDDHQYEYMKAGRTNTGYTESNIDQTNGKRLRQSGSAKMSNKQKFIPELKHYIIGFVIILGMSVAVSSAVSYYIALSGRTLRYL